MQQFADESPAPIVWEDENWVLVADPTAAAPVALILQPREPEELGHLDDAQAAQLGRICNRLVRIIEYLPGAGRVEVGRGSDGAVAWFRATGSGDGVEVGADHLHAIATRLANWGGEARA